MYLNGRITKLPAGDRAEKQDVHLDICARTMSIKMKFKLVYEKKDWMNIRLDTFVAETDVTLIFLLDHRSLTK